MKIFKRKAQRGKWNTHAQRVNNRQQKNVKPSIPFPVFFPNFLRNQADNWLPK